MNRFLLILCFVLAAVSGHFIGFNCKTGCSWNGNATVFLFIVLAGAFGGLLYTARDSGIEFPHRDPEHKHILKLGWIADCAFGIAGAFVVFLILPTEIATNAQTKSLSDIVSTVDLIKLLAIALVGGYGGRSLVDRALANLTKDVEEAKENAKEAKEKLVQIQETDTVARELTHLHLDGGEEEQDLSKLKTSIKKASRSARFEIFKEARKVREANWKNNVALMKRTIPVFEALIENESGEKYHRNHGQLGYAIKDQIEDGEAKTDWKRALDELNNAINLRNKEGIKGFKMYEFNRAMCRIKLGSDANKIIEDIKSASERDSIHKKIKKLSIFKEWAAANDFDLDTLE